MRLDYLHEHERLVDRVVWNVTRHGELTDKEMLSIEDDREKLYCAIDTARLRNLLSYEGCIYRLGPAAKGRDVELLELMTINGPMTLKGMQDETFWMLDVLSETVHLLLDGGLIEREGNLYMPTEQAMDGAR